MHNKSINLSIVAQVAEGLGELNEKMVIVGGAVISLYADDPAADEIRPTSDIDMTINLASYAEWVSVEKRLSALGFSPNPQGHSSCSFTFKQIDIDIMLAEDSIKGASNRWYKPGFEFLKTISLSEGIKINILSSVYFLATKLEAFKDRGKSDYYGSHDYEDIIYFLDNRIDVVNEVFSAEGDVKTYIQDELKKIRKHPYFEEILSVHLHPSTREERLKLLLEKIDKIIGLENNDVKSSNSLNI